MVYGNMTEILLKFSCIYKCYITICLLNNKYYIVNIEGSKDVGHICKAVA